MQEEIFLKGCPFCGGKPRFYTITTINAQSASGFSFTLKCETCGTQAPHDRPYELLEMLTKDGERRVTKDDRDRAREDWNRRFT